MQAEREGERSRERERKGEGERGGERGREGHFSLYDRPFSLLGADG